MDDSPTNNETVEMLIRNLLLLNARQFAFELAVSDALGYDKKQRDVFLADIQKRFKSFTLQMANQIEDADPEAAAKILRDMIYPTGGDLAAPA
jgi:hypothetical protein